MFSAMEIVFNLTLLSLVNFQLICITVFRMPIYRKHNASGMAIMNHFLFDCFNFLRRMSRVVK